MVSITRVLNHSRLSDDKIHVRFASSPGRMQMRIVLILIFGAKHKEKRIKSIETSKEKRKKESIDNELKTEQAKTNRRGRDFFSLHPFLLPIEDQKFF